MKAKLNVPRESHKKKNKKKVAEFKADVQSRIVATIGDKPMDRLRVLVQNESRLGLLTMLKRRITAKGIKPIQTVNPRYESYYLYGAVDPRTGEHLFLEMPNLDSACFEVFIEQLSITSPDDYNVVILANARFHKTCDLVIPDNVGLLFLPPYAPELNPIERLWQDIKKDVAFQLYPTLSALKHTVADSLKKLSTSHVASITRFPYLIHAINALAL